MREVNTGLASQPLGPGGSEGVTLMFYLKHTSTFVDVEDCRNLFRVDTFQVHSTRTRILSQMPTLLPCLCVLKILIASYVLKVCLKVCS